MPGPFAEMTSDCPARFPKTARVRSRAAYAQVFDKARRCHHPALTLHMAPAENGVEEARLGLAVSRKVDARAVGRNRIKRVLRETFRLHRDRLAPGSFVVVVKPAAAGIDNVQLAEAFFDVLRRAGALPRPDATGTMHGDIPSRSRGPRGNRPDLSMPE